MLQHGQIGILLTDTSLQCRRRMRALHTDVLADFRASTCPLLQCKLFSNTIDTCRNALTN